MKLLINQKSEEIPEGAHIGSLLQTLGIQNFDGLAVAVNERVIPKKDWKACSLSESDSISILRAVQGG